MGIYRAYKLQHEDDKLNHPVGRFARISTNKRPAESGICAGMGDPSPYFTYFKEGDSERYCLVSDDPAFCKGIGNICDVDGSIKPECAYCKSHYNMDN